MKTVAFSLACAALCAMTSLAHATLSVSVSAPSTVPVYTSTTYNVTVDQAVGTAHGVVVDIHLPASQQGLLGTLSSVPGGCSLDGTQIVCNVGTLAGGTSTTISFDFAIAESSETPEFFVRSFATSNGAYVTATHTPTLTYPMTPIAPPQPVSIEYCTDPGMDSFLRCTTPQTSGLPQSTLDSGGAVTFTPARPGFTGTWSQPVSQDELEFSWFYRGMTLMQFQGNAVGGDCFEGTWGNFRTPVRGMMRVCF